MQGHLERLRSLEVVQTGLFKNHSSGLIARGVPDSVRLSSAMNKLSEGYCQMEETFTEKLNQVSSTVEGKLSELSASFESMQGKLTELFKGIPSEVHPFGSLCILLCS